MTEKHMPVESITLQLEGRTVIIRPKEKPDLIDVIKALCPNSPLVKGIKRQENRK